MNEITQDLIALTITELHAGIAASLRRSVEDAIQIGELLEAKKRELVHGEFLPWIERELPFSRYTAVNYMRVFQYQDKCRSVPHLQEAYRIAQLEDQKVQAARRQEQQQLIDAHKQTGVKPEGWDRSTQREYERQEGHEEFLQEKAKLDEERTRERKPEKPPGIKSEVDKLLERLQQHESLRLSNPLENATQEEVFEYLADYIRRFEGVSRQLETTHNLIKRLKMVAGDLQRASVQEGN